MLEERQASGPLEAKDLEDCGSDLFGRVAGQAGQGLGRRRSLPIAGEAQRGCTDGVVRGFQQSQNARGIALGPHLAGSGRFAQRGQGASRGSIIETTRDGLPQQRSQFFGATGLTDELDPGARTVPREAALLDDAPQNSAGLFGSDSLQGEGQLFFAPLGFPGTRFQGSDPRLGQFVDRQPERVV